jgi:hypothetical protein
VVLHYSGYGYDQNGAPLWLAEALRHRPPGIVRVLTYFHELYANGRPWQRAFWYSSRQRRVAIEVAQLSDALLTNREESARWLEGQSGRIAGSVGSLPICSNVGEVATRTHTSEREAIAVCFGAAEFKECFLNRFAGITARICSAAGIREMVSIGGFADVNDDAFAVHGIAVRDLGILPSCEVSNWLQKARLGFMTYFPDYLAKSSSLAAMAAHGVSTVMGNACNRSGDQFVPGASCLCLSEALKLSESPSKLLERLDQVGQRLFDWYQSHNAAAHAGKLLEEAWGGSAKNRLNVATCSLDI